MGRLAAAGRLPRDQGSLGNSSIHVQRADRFAERDAADGLAQQLGDAELADAVAASKVAFVCGTQAMSDPAWMKMKELILIRSLSLCSMRTNNKLTDEERKVIRKDVMLFLLITTFEVVSILVIFRYF